MAALPRTMQVVSGALANGAGEAQQQQDGGHGTDSHSRTATSTTTSSTAATSSSDLAQVLQALQAIYAPASTNDTRRQATEFLEQAKRHPDAPLHGHTLARDGAQPTALRYYGLTLLEHTIRYRWDELTPDQTAVLRDYIVELAQATTAGDAVYLRNKVAQLWSEIAKRSWAADEWAAMDEQLVALWAESPHHQAVVLCVLETLCDDVFNRDDAAAGLRGSDLGRACVDIFTPLAVLQEILPARDKSLAVRCGSEGWLSRLCANLAECLRHDYHEQDAVRVSAIKTMHALRAAMPWTMPKAIAATRVVEAVCKALAVPVVEMQLAAIEVLQAIYGRHHLSDHEFVALVCPMFAPEAVSLLRQVYAWTLQDMDVNAIDDQKYTLCKKLSELANSLGLFIEQKPQAVPEGSDLAGVFAFLYEIMRNPSLVVSIPALHCWTKLLRSRIVRDSEAVTTMVAGLLETCCARLVRYESLPEDSEDITLQFLHEDIDTTPERHAFLGNYRRFCADIVETLVRRTPAEAMEHILAQATSMLQNISREHATFQPQTFSKNAYPVLRVDAQVTVIEAALKGYMKWIQAPGEDAHDNERIRNDLENSLEQWGRQILQTRFEDPEIARKIITLMSSLSTRALGSRPAFALSFLEYMLTIRLADDTSLVLYSEAVKDLERMCSLEMQRLAMKFADDFMNVYDQLEAKVNETINDHTTDERQRMAYSAFLFIIIHRSTTLERSMQEERMGHMLNQVKDAWRNSEFSKAISSFQSFCGVLGMAPLPEFLAANNFSSVQDWSNQMLPSDGQALQATILDRSQHLPLRLTKALLAASTEKLRDGSPAYEMAAALWAEATPILLPNLLQLISHAQAFNDINHNWSHLPPELQQVIKRVLTDRFWQAGISTESRDDFFARVSGSKSTYEGFASTVRGTIRQIRESSYYILYSLARFRDSFYGIPDLPGPLSQALFGHAGALTAHHLCVLLTVSTHLIEGCPAELRPHFLPPMIQGLFRELDRKISTEWNEVARHVAESGDNDNLTDEMKTESILRQLTYSAVSLVAVLLDARQELRTDDHARTNTDNLPMHEFILSEPSVLEPILLFCTSILRVRDTRSVVTTIRALRTLLPRFKAPSPIRSYFCNDVLKASITSLHEPYFVDCQKDLASLIAGIIHLEEDDNNSANSVPRSIILSLPGMQDQARVERRLAKLKQTNRHDERTQRSIVLDLLSGIKGVSIHEQGRIQRPEHTKKKGMLEMYVKMEMDQNGGRATGIVRGDSPGLAGVSDMFGGE